MVRGGNGLSVVRPASGQDHRQLSYNKYGGSSGPRLSGLSQLFVECDAVNGGGERIELTVRGAQPHIRNPPLERAKVEDDDSGESETGIQKWRRWYGGCRS